jgi:hypothetical protein
MNGFNRFYIGNDQLGLQTYFNFNEHELSKFKFGCTNIISKTEIQ